MAFDAGAVLGRLEFGLEGWKKSVETVKADAGTIGAKVKETSSQMGGLAGSADGAATSTGGLWKQFAIGQLVVDALRKGIGELTGFIKDTVSAAMKQEQALKDLEGALMTTGRATDKLLPSLVAYSESLQKQTKYSDDAIQKTMALMAQLTDLDERGLKEATRGAIGFASVLGVDLNTAATAVAKAMTGNYMVLSRYGIKLKENATDEEKRAELLQKLAVFYQRAESEVNTFGGALAQLKNVWGDLREEVGNAIVKNEKVRELIQKLKEDIIKLIESGKFEEWVGNLSLSVGNLIKIFDGLYDAIKAVKAIADLLPTNWGDKFFNEQMREINKLAEEGKKKALEFQGSLKVLVPTLEELRKEMEKGPENWAAYTERIRESDKMLSKNKETITKWIETALEKLGLLPKLAEATNKLGKVFTDFSLKTKTGLTKELKDATSALDLLKKSSERTPGAIKILEDKIKALKEQLYGLSSVTITNTFVPAARNMDRALTEFSATIVETAVPACRDLSVALQNMSPTIKNIEEKGKEFSVTWEDIADDMAKAFGEAFSSIIKDGLSFKNFWESLWQGIVNIVSTAIGKIITVEFPKLAKGFGELLGAAEESAQNVGTIILAWLTIWIKKLIDVINYTTDFARKSGEVIFGPEITESVKNYLNLIKEVKKGIEELAKSGWESSDILNEAWGKLISAAKEVGAEGNKSFIDLIKRMRELGLESKTLNAYMQEWLNKIPAPLTSLVAGFDVVGGSIENLGTLALTTFNAMTASGVSWIDAVNKMQNPLAALAAKYTELGLEVDPALEKLFQIVGVTEANKELFTAVDANRQILEALGNTGWLTADAMKALTGQATNYYDQLTLAGLASDDALRAMAPTLQDIINYAATYSLKIDDATQKLIDDATALGIVKEAAKSTSTVMESGFTRIGNLLERIAIALGADISDLLEDVKDKAKKVGKGFEEGFDTAKNAATDAGKWINDTFKGLSYTVPITYEAGEFPKGGGVAKGGAEAWQTGFEGIVTQPMRPLLGEVPEYVKVVPLARGIPERLGAGWSIMNTTVNIYAQRLDDRTIDEAAEKIFTAIRRQESRHG